MDEKELIKKARNGDKQAMEELYNSIFDSLYKFIRFKTESIQVTEDICSEAFIRAFENLDKFKGNSSFKTYVYTIAKNLLFKQYSESAKIKTSSELSIEVSETEDLEKHINEIDDDKTGDDDLRELNTILKILDDRSREVLELKYLSGLTQTEISGVTGLSVSNVKVIAFRALEKIKKEWPPPINRSDQEGG